MFVTSYSVTYCIYTFRGNREFVFIVIVQYTISSKDIELIKCLSDIFCRVCKIEQIKHILSVQFTHSHCDDWENIYTLFYHHHQIGSVNYYPLFRTRSWNNGVCCVSLYSSYIVSVQRNQVGHGACWNVLFKPMTKEYASTIVVFYITIRCS